MFEWESGATRSFVYSCVILKTGRDFLAEKKNGGNTVSKVWEIAEPIAKSLGLSLWDVRFVKEGASWFLRVFIDKDGGITVDDCSDMSHALDAPLDEADPIDTSYYLEVSSPGIERELTRPEHFEKMMHRDVIVKLIRPVDNVREFYGKLEGFEDNVITIVTEERTMQIKKSETVFVKLDDFYIEGESDNEQ